MKYCKVHGFRYPDTSTHCRTCGAKLVYDSEMSDPSRISSAGCPKPQCSELVAQPNTAYCRQCGTELQTISVDLWVNKILNPAFERSPVDVLLWPAALFEPSAEMGLERREVSNCLDRFISTRAGVNRGQVDQWMQDAIAMFMARDSDLENVKRRVSKLASDRRISASFSSHILDAFLRSSLRTGPMRQAPFVEQPAPSLAQQRTAESVGNGNRNPGTKEFNSQSATPEANTSRINESLRSGVQGHVDKTTHEAQAADSRSASPGLGAEQPKGSPDEMDNKTEATEESTGTKHHKGRTERKTLGHHVAWLFTFVIVVFVLAWAGIEISNRQKPPVSNTPVPTPIRETPSPEPAQAEPSPPDGMALIRNGDFYMGRDDGDEFERPAHPEKVDPFYMDKHEVSRQKYQECVNKGRCDPPYGWDNSSFPIGTDALPVTGVRWDDARKYCNSVAKQLPTEIEWEYAARGTDRRRLYPWGEQWLDGRANTNGNGLREVGAFKAQTDTGLYDLIGNAWEWTSSKYWDYPGRDNSSVSKKLKSDDLRIIRGGCYLSKKDVTATHREALPANRERGFYAQTGFRCVQPLSQ